MDVKHYNITLGNKTNRFRTNGCWDIAATNFVYFDTSHKIDMLPT